MVGAAAERTAVAVRDHCEHGLLQPCRRGVRLTPRNGRVVSLMPAGVARCGQRVIDGQLMHGQHAEGNGEDADHKQQVRPAASRPDHAAQGSNAKAEDTWVTRSKRQPTDRLAANTPLGYSGASC